MHDRTVLKGPITVVSVTITTIGATLLNDNLRCKRGRYPSAFQAPEWIWCSVSLLYVHQRKKSATKPHPILQAQTDSWENLVGCMWIIRKSTKTILNGTALWEKFQSYCYTILHNVMHNHSGHSNAGKRSDAGTQYFDLQNLESWML